MDLLYIWIKIKRRVRRSFKMFSLIFVVIVIIVIGMFAMKSGTTPINPREVILYEKSMDSIELIDQQLYLTTANILVTPISCPSIRPNNEDTFYDLCVHHMESTSLVVKDRQAYTGRLDLELSPGNYVIMIYTNDPTFHATINMISRNDVIQAETQSIKTIGTGTAAAHATRTILGLSNTIVKKSTSTRMVILGNPLHTFHHLLEETINSDMTIMIVSIRDAPPLLTVNGTPVSLVQEITHDNYSYITPINSGRITISQVFQAKHDTPFIMFLFRKLYFQYIQ